MKTLLTLSLLILFQLGFSQSPCSDYKKGTFYYKASDGGMVQIIRTKRKQVEIYNNGKSKTILKVKWANDSTYILTYKKTINGKNCLKKGDQMKVVVYKCVNGRFYGTYTSPCSNGRFTFTKPD